MRRRGAGRVGLVLAGTLLGLGLCELGLRWVERPAERARKQLRFDARFGTVPRHSWVHGFRIESPPTTVRIREQLIAVPPPATELRVLFVGDSGTEGAFVPLAQSFPMQFGARLGGQHRGRPLQTINAGVFGMTNLDELSLLQSELWKLQPDVVVLGLFMANDINFNLGSPMWTRDDGGTAGLYAALRTHSALVHALHLAAQATGARLGAGRVPGADAQDWVPLPMRLVDARGYPMLDYPAGEVATYLRPPSALIEEAFTRLQAILAEFQRLGEVHGFGFRVLIIPTPSAVAGQLTLLHYPDIEAELARQGLPFDRRSIDVTQPTRRVLAICDALELLCVDPTARMQAAGMGVFFADDEHPTARGHAVLADALRAEAGALLAPH